MSIINIEELTRETAHVRNLFSDFQKRISPEILFHHDPYILAFHILNEFSFEPKIISPIDRESIENGCETLLIKGKRITKADDSLNPVKECIKWVLEFEKMPAPLLLELDSKVKSDLQAVQELMNIYENDAAIKSYKEGRQPSEHEGKTKVDFYKRTVTEMDKIARHLAVGTKERALMKAKVPDPLRETYESIFQQYFDRPYSWWHADSIEEFDYRKINGCRHRIKEIPVEHKQQATELYDMATKSEFYKLLSNHYSPETIFKELFEYYIKVIPKIDERDNIFKELKELFITEKWYGFIALALTQIEGIFSDMLYITDPSRLFGSLSRKVSAVRTYHERRTYNLDYFEYELPRLRNSFLHTGSIAGKEAKWIAHDLLYDLGYLMEIFNALNDPSVRLNKIIRHRSLDFLFEIETVSHLMAMVEKIKRRQAAHRANKDLKKLVDSWDAYEQAEIADSDEMDVFIEKLYREIENDIPAVFDKIRSLSEEYTAEINLETMELTDFQKQRGKLIVEVKSFAIYMVEEYREIFTAIDVLQHCNKMFPSMSPTIKQTINDLKTRHAGSIKKITGLQSAFENLQY